MEPSEDPQRAFPIQNFILVYGDLMNMDFSGIGKKIRSYLNSPAIPQKTII